MSRVYVPRFFVSSQQRFGATDIKALGASRLSGLGQTVLQLLGKSALQLLGKSALQLHFIYKIGGESKTRREESGGVRGEGERERERQSEREHMHAGERVREKALWLLLLYVFSSTWACPMQIGLSQECCLFYLKSSLWSSDLPCLLVTAILDSFSLFYLPNSYNLQRLVPGLTETKSTSGVPWIMPLSNLAVFFLIQKGCTCHSPLYGHIFNVRYEHLW